MNGTEMTATNVLGSFAGKVAFVTGAGSGMGRTTARAFAREGARVVLTDVSDRGNQDTVRMIKSSAVGLCSPAMSISTPLLSRLLRPECNGASAGMSRA